MKNRDKKMNKDWTDYYHIVKTVDAMDDDYVCDTINFNYDIKMYDVNKAIRSRDIKLSTCRPYNNGNHHCTNTNKCKGHWFMPQMRDLLIDLMITT